MLLGPGKGGRRLFSFIFCTGKFLLLRVLLSLVLLAEKEAGKPRNGQLTLLGRGERTPT